jgi:hypothetical protein
MEQKSFIVFVTAGGKPVVNPMICFCETHDEAQDLATTDLATKFSSIPMGTLLHIFDTDTEVTYLGEPRKPEPEEPESEDNDQTNDDVAGACKCPHGDHCQFSTVPGKCGYGADDTGEKLCAEPVFGAGTGIPEEGRVYKPEELLFAIGPYDHQDLIPDMKFVVYLTVADDFAITGYQTDDLGGHNVDNDALRAAGVNDAELMESVFEVLPLEGDTREALAGRLIDAGFGYRQSFQDFMDRCIDGDPEA